MYMLCVQYWLNSCTGQYDEVCLLSTTALSVDNILKELKQVKWETLRLGILQPSLSQQLKIEEKYAVETERKREGVKYWLWNCPYASWRMLIIQLDE